MARCRITTASDVWACKPHSLTSQQSSRKPGLSYWRCLCPACLSCQFEHAIKVLPSSLHICTWLVYLAGMAYVAAYAAVALQLSVWPGQPWAGALQALAIIGAIFLVRTHVFNCHHAVCCPMSVPCCVGEFHAVLGSQLIACNTCQSIQCWLHALLCCTFFHHHCCVTWPPTNVPQTLPRMMY